MQTPKPPAQSHIPSNKADREALRAAALRANLARRKAQKRARDTSADHEKLQD